MFDFFKISSTVPSEVLPTGELVLCPSLSRKAVASSDAVQERIVLITETSFDASIDVKISTIVASIRIWVRIFPLNMLITRETPSRDGK